MKKLSLVLALFSPFAYASDWTWFNNGEPWNWLSELPQNSPGGPDHIIPLEYSGSYTYTRESKVWGSTETPPWTPPFASLFDTSQSMLYNYTVTIGSFKGGRVYDKLNVSEGQQTWAKPGVLAKRERLVKTITEARHLFTWNLGSGSDPD
jgi:hypothetical protein